MATTGPVYHDDGSLTPTAKRIERLQSLHRMFLSTYGPGHRLTLDARRRLNEALQAVDRQRGAA